MRMSEQMRCGEFEFMQLIYLIKINKLIFIDKKKLLHVTCYTCLVLCMITHTKDVLRCESSER